MLSLAVLGSVVAGLLTAALGVARLFARERKVTQGALLILGAFLLQSWWLLLLALAAYKMFILREDP